MKRDILTLVAPQSLANQAILPTAEPAVERISFPEELLNVSNTGPSPQKRQRQRVRAAKIKRGRRSPARIVINRSEGNAGGNGMEDTGNYDAPWPDAEVDTGVVSPVAENTESDQGNHFTEFVEATLAAAMGFYQVSQSLYVVQGWDSKSGTGTVSKIFFLGK